MAKKKRQEPDFDTQRKIKKRFGTQRRFAQVAGIPEVELSNYLRGVKPWKAEHQKKAAECLGE
jgi:hypothetical protein